MYRAFFGLTENPFSLSPDPAYFYRSAQHEEALAILTYGVQSHKGFIVMTGEVGTGKTTVLECLRDYLDSEKVLFSFLFNSRLAVEQFFEMVAYDLELPCPANDKAKVLLALHQLLVQRAAKDLTTALIVDEAHDLSWDLLEEIRMLGNLENRAGKLLQIVLAGQPELDHKLDAPNLRQLKQRIVLRCCLRGLQEEQTSDYIRLRLRRAGLEDQTVLPAGLLSEIHRRTQGIPRLVNVVCDNLLLTAFAMAEKVATLEMLDEVSADLRLDWPGRAS